MRINEIKLKYFRNHKNFNIKFDNDLILINGNNGTGKTNLLEAIYILATGKSSKATYDRELINYEYDFATVTAKALLDNDNNDEEKDLEIAIVKNPNFENTSIKKVKINKVPKTLNKFVGTLNAVMFAPEDIQVITGSPAERRRFIDLLLTQTEKDYKKHLSSYTKVIRQRNKILESINETGMGWDQIDYWTEQALDLGTKIQESRDNMFQFFQNNINIVMKTLNKKHVHSEVVYEKNTMSKERLDHYREKEVFAKTTLVGPHRDDFYINLDGHNIASFGSRGQQRTVLLSLKLMEIDFIDNIKKVKPILLLDDIFSELDEHHRKAIIEAIGKQQTFLTSAEDITHLLPSQSQIIAL